MVAHLRCVEQVYSLGKTSWAIARTEVERPTRTGWGDLACLSPPPSYESASSLIGTSSCGRSKAVAERWTCCRTGATQKAPAGIRIGQGMADSNQRTRNVPKSASIFALTRRMQQAPGRAGPRPGLHAQVYTSSVRLSSGRAHACRWMPMSSPLGVSRQDHPESLSTRTLLPCLAARAARLAKRATFGGYRVAGACCIVWR